jgi:pimeloyl-ACP methyl ester carboxylesterase
MGEDDAVFSALEVMSRELPGARVVTFAGAGHGLPVVRAGEFTDTLLRFLDDVEAGEVVAGRERVA